MNEGKCWHGIKKGKNVFECGLDARLYEVSRPALSGSFAASPSLRFKAYFCTVHKDMMEKDGFLLTLQTSLVE